MSPIPVECRLPSALLPQRLAHVAGVLQRDLVASDLAENELRLAFHRSPERIRDLTQLVAEESECCAFLSFDLAVPSAGDVRLTVRAPADSRAWLVAFQRGALSA